LSKGADHVVVLPAEGTIRFSEKPAVFSDALCYLDWIAAQFNLRLPAGFALPEYCAQSTGDKTDFNKTICLSRDYEISSLSSSPEQCKFSSEHSKCKLNTYNPDLRPATNSNFFACLNLSNKTAVCANNCAGVEANAVVVNGLAAVSSVAARAVPDAAAADLDLTGSALGAGSIMAMLGLGGMKNMASGNITTLCSQVDDLSVLFSATS
jgi:hypothetical protein